MVPGVRAGDAVTGCYPGQPLPLLREQKKPAPASTGAVDALLTLPFDLMLTIPGRDCPLIPV